jgi:hypothetical protein
MRPDRQARHSLAESASNCLTKSCRISSFQSLLGVQGPLPGALDFAWW